MATWHQRRAGNVAPKKGKWTVLVDPPNECRATVIFSTEHEALKYRERLRARGQTYAYILPPTA